MKPGNLVFLTELLPFSVKLADGRFRVNMDTEDHSRATFR